MARITADRVADLKRQADETGDAFDEIRFTEALDAMTPTEHVRFTDYFNGVTDESEPDVEECIHPGIFVTDYNVTTWADGSQTCWCPNCDDNIPITEL
jgi:hypothetical protein